MDRTERLRFVRILLSCLQSLRRHPIPAYEFWRDYFERGLVEAGHEVIEVPQVDWAEGLTYPDGSQLEKWRAKTWEAVESFAAREHASNGIDLFIGYLYPQQVEETAIAEFQRKGIPCVNFFCDNVREFAALPPEYRPFSLHWVPEFEALPMYRQAGVPHVHLPMPCWISPGLRTIPSRETEPPTFLGSADDLRRDLLGRAQGNSGELVVRGPGWIANRERDTEAASRQVRSISGTLQNQLALIRRHGMGGLLTKVYDRVWPLRPVPMLAAQIRPALFGVDYVRVTREAMITIGVNRVPSAKRSSHRPLCYSRLRDIEAPMLGACYLTEWTEGLEHMYELGTEIETYRNADELRDKLHTLGLDRERRSTMRERAQRRALADHSVVRSIGYIKTYLGL